MPVGAHGRSYARSSLAHGRRVPILQTKERNLEISMKLIASTPKPIRRKPLGTSLAEVVIAIAISSMSISATVTGYMLAAHRSEWSAYSLAAQSLAMQRMEQTRSAKWNPNGYPPVDMVKPTNFPMVLEILDVPIAGTNIVYATNITTITTVSANPPVKMVRVDCIWRFLNRGFFTNTIVSYRSPDQ